MMEEPAARPMPWQWRDLYWFLQIARAKNLREAATVCEVSPATLSRRMTALEHDLKVNIFVRDSRGYTLTPYGRRVLEIVERMDSVASEIAELDQTGISVVKVSAGSWMSLFLTSRVEALQRPEDDFTVEWRSTMTREDIARRRVHIGIRNAG